MGLEIHDFSVLVIVNKCQFSIDIFLSGLLAPPPSLVLKKKRLYFKKILKKEHSIVCLIVPEILPISSFIIEVNDRTKIQSELF